MNVSATPKARIQSPAWTGLAPQRDGTKLLTAGVDGRIRAFEGETGEALWTSPVIEESLGFQTSGDIVITGGRDSMAAIDSRDGHLLWKKDGRQNLVGLTSEVAATADRTGLQVLELASGATLWESESHQTPVLWQNMALTLGGEADQAEILRAHDPKTGKVLWSVSDGDIQHLIPGSRSLVYSNSKIGKHKEAYQLVSSRSAAGAAEWTHKARGPLRSEPIFSPDGSQLALKEKNPANPSRSFLSILDAQTGESVFSVDAAHKFEVNFLPDGGVVLAETEFAFVPGEGETRLRRLDNKGREEWRKPGRPDWVWGGEHLVSAAGSELSKLDSHTGETLWSKSLQGTPTPVSADGERMTLMVDNCKLQTLELSSGEVSSTVDTGDKMFVGSDLDPTPLSDHQGRVWEQSLPTGGRGQFQGAWPVAEPFHMSLLSGPITRAEESAVFVDWDGDSKGTEHDPILLDAQNSVVTWEQLTKRDSESDGRLETESLDDLKLWFDTDRNGEVTSAEELSLLVSESFDKARLEMDQGLLWLASDSKCHE